MKWADRVEGECITIYSLIESNPRITGAQISERLGWPKERVNTRLNTLLHDGRVRFTRKVHEPRKWEVISWM